MTIDLARYRRVIKPVCKAFADRNVKKEPMELMCGELARATDCHIIAICYYLSELYGMTPELSNKIDRLITYYHVEQVINQEVCHE